MGKKRKGYAIGREIWCVDWSELRTPLGLPGQRLAFCARTSFTPLDDNKPPKEDEVRYYAASMPPEKMSPARQKKLIRDHWLIENGLHHVKDRTWLEDRHWLKNPKTAAVVVMLRSVACCLVRKAKGPGMKSRRYCPERIEYYSCHKRQALKLITGTPRF